MVNDEVTIWTDTVYLIIEGDKVKLVTPDGVLLEDSKSALKEAGVVFTINNFIVTFNYIDKKGNPLRLKFIEGMEFIPDKIKKD